MYGVGYPVLEAAIGGRYVVGFLLLLVVVVGKIVASSLTIGTGGSGGVFAPSPFVGGTAGTAFGYAAAALFPALDLHPGAFGLVGMAAVFAGAAHAPITAVLIVFELTGDYALILPLMAAVVLATGLSHLVSRDNIYTLELLRRGIDLAADTPTDEALRRVVVAQVMRPADGTPPAPELPVSDPDGSVHDALGVLAAHRGAARPVREGPDGPLLVTLTEHDLLDHLRGVAGQGTVDR